MTRAVSTSAAGQVVRLVRDPGHGSAARAAAATAHRTARRITPGLVGALADDSGVVRVEAAAVLAMLTRH